MATGGDVFVMDNPYLDGDRIDNDDNDKEGQEVNRTQPFQLGSASTRRPPGEQIQMQTMQQEQSGLPATSYAEISLLIDLHEDDKPAMIERLKKFIKKKFPKVGFRKLSPLK